MWLKIVKRILFFSIILLLLFFSWFTIEFVSSPHTPSRSLILEIEKGRTAQKIAQKLQEKQVISKKWPFLAGYTLFYSSHSLKAGEYRFQIPLSPKKALKKLTQGKVYLHPVTVPEGLTIREMAPLFQSALSVEPKKFLEAASNLQLISSIDPKAGDLEGYLYPETYHFPKGTSAQEIVAAMVSEFKEVFIPSWETRAKKIHLSVREVVILASLIEKETAVPEEKPLVSAVFHNRLDKGMKLDCDPTIIYALKKKNKFGGRLRSQDLKLDSPYNTYIFGGLPPGPIANPGKESLKAALYPADVSYLYFVSKNDGSHHFSRTFKEHQRAVNKYQR